MECYTFASKGIIGRVKNHVAFSYNSATTNNPPPDKTSDTFTMSHSWMRIFDGIGCKTFMLKDWDEMRGPLYEKYRSGLNHNEINEMFNSFEELYAVKSAKPTQYIDYDADERKLSFMQGQNPQVKKLVKKKEDQ